MRQERGGGARRRAGSPVVFSVGDSCKAERNTMGHHDRNSASSSLSTLLLDGADPIALLLRAALERDPFASEAPVMVITTPGRPSSLLAMGGHSSLLSPENHPAHRVFGRRIHVPAFGQSVHETHIIRFTAAAAADDSDSDASYDSESTSSDEDATDGIHGSPSLTMDDDGGESTEYDEDEDDGSSDDDDDDEEDDDDDDDSDDPMSEDEDHGMVGTEADGGHHHHHDHDYHTALTEMLFGIDRAIGSVMARSFLDAPPPVSRGLPPSLIETLRTRVHAAEDGDGACAVCLEDFSVGDRVRVLACDHAYHIACIDRWLDEHDACPCCRAPAVDQNDPRVHDLFSHHSADAGSLAPPALGEGHPMEPGPMPQWLRIALAVPVANC